MDSGLSRLSIAVVATDGLRRRCQAILARAARPGFRSRDIPFASALRLLRRYRPRVLLLDAADSPVRALRILPTLKRLSPSTGVLLLGRAGTPTEVVLEGLRRGAWGHISERDLADDLLKAVRAVATREPWVPRRLGAAIVAELRASRAASSRGRTRLRLIRGGASAFPARRNLSHVNRHRRSVRITGGRAGTEP